MRAIVLDDEAGPALRSRLEHVLFVAYLVLQTLSCSGPTGPVPTLRAGSYLLTVNIERKADGSEPCSTADGLGGLIAATIVTAMKVEAMGSVFRATASTPDGGTVSLSLTVVSAGSIATVGGSATGIAVGIPAVPLPPGFKPNEVEFTGAANASASVQGELDRSGVASGKAVGNVTYRHAGPPAIEYFCHNSNTTWRLVPQ